MAAFGFMAELARGGTEWLSPQLLGIKPDVDALLPYWLGAWFIQLLPSWVAADFAARIPYILLLTLTLLATWNGTYYLARSPQAQPVAFAFGGEALPTDYARALADGGLLAFMACLGLAQLSHETTPALAQLCFTALSFYAFCALPYRTLSATLAGGIGLAGLALSGAPTMAVLFGFGSAVIFLLDSSPNAKSRWHTVAHAGGIAIVTALVALLAYQLNVWKWRIELPESTWHEWRSLGRLLLWFTWPAWPLALWTLWRWRHQWIRGGAPSRHLLLPLWFSSISVGATLTTSAADRSLLLALPALAALAAFSLPTLKRSVSALIDWFTLIFFSGCAFIVWVVWIAMQTGIPRQPAANVARLAPGFEHSFSFLPFCLALMATLAWAWLVKWRVGKHRAAIWKSVVLPAGGAALSWMLLMTLWMPLLDYARSYAPLVHRSMVVMQQKPRCVEELGLSLSQIAAFQFHADLRVEPMGSKHQCPWLIVDKDSAMLMSPLIEMSEWKLHSNMRHLPDRGEDLQIYKRTAQR